METSASRSRAGGRFALRSRFGPMAQIAPFGLLTVLVIGVPLVLLAIYSLRESSFLGVGGGPNLDQYKLVFESANTVRVMVKTLYVSLAVATIATILAFVISYAITFRMGKRTAMVALGIVVASGVASFLVRIFAWGIILGNNGLINSGLEKLGLITSPLQFLYFGQFAIAVTMVYAYLPIATLIVQSAMQDIDPRTLEASRDLGSGRWRTIFRVVAPQARVGLLSAFVVTLMIASGDFVTPRIVGGTSGVMVGAQVQELAQSAGDLPGAAALALSFIAVLAVALCVLALVMRIVAPPMRVLGNRLDPLADRVARRLPVRARNVSLSLPAAIALLVYLSVPTILVILFSFNAADSIGLPLTGLTSHWYGEIVGRIGFTDALHGSLIVAVVATLGSLAIGIPVAFALVRLRGTWEKIVWVAVLLPFVIPGALLGSALLVTSSQTGIATGLALTAVVHIVLLVSVIVVVVYARLSGIDPHVIEAARDLGASAWRGLRTVTLPLLRSAILGAAILCAAYSLDEVFVTQFTIGTSNTVPIWLLGQAKRGFSPGIYALGVLLLAGTITAFTLAVITARRSFLTAGRE